jgi:hypothetical protein
VITFELAHQTLEMALIARIASPPQQFADRIAPA